MKADKLVGKTIESAVFYEGDEFHLTFADGSNLTVLGGNELDVFFDGQLIECEEGLEECDLESKDFALVAEYEERQHAMELADFDNFGGLRDNTDPILKATINAEK